MTAVNQYIVHSEMCANWGYDHLHESIEKRAIDEMKHAEKSEDHDLADLCRDLAVQEADHFRKFKKMGEELVERPASRPLTWDELHFAQMLIEERVLSAPEAARDAAASGDVTGMLETAIRLEKDSVLFYNELFAEVDENDAPAVQEIIDEEKRHVRSLVKARRDRRRQATT